MLAEEKSGWKQSDSRPVRRWRPARPKQPSNNRNQSMTSVFSQNTTGVNCCKQTQSNSESADADSTLAGQKQLRRSMESEDKSTGSLTPPAVPSATVRDPHTDAHRVGDRWHCTPEISNAQDSPAFTRRKVSTDFTHRNRSVPPLSFVSAIHNQPVSFRLVRHMNQRSRL